MNYSHYLDQYLVQLAALLTDLGVPGEQGLFAAFVVTYVGLTLLVLLLVVLLLRRRQRSARPEDEPVEEPQREVRLADQAPDSTETAGAQQPEPLAAIPPSSLEKADLEPDAGGTARGGGEDLEVTPVEKIIPPAAEPAAPPDRAGLFQRLRQGLAKTRSSLLGRIDALLAASGRLDEEFVEELEEILITADFGMQATRELVTALQGRLRVITNAGSDEVRKVLQEEIHARLLTASEGWTEPPTGPLVIMVVGVNGVGKTTTIGKLARQFAAEGKKVVLGAGDTFRAAAVEQLKVWGDRAGAEVICQAEGSDPAAVAFDTARAALARKADVLILDTAGRLHTKVNLMEELKKVRRVLGREIPDAPHETLLVLDATTGQNALIQAKMFREAVDVTAVALTKLDGTAKGGIVVAINSQLGLPVRLIGVGEGVADLRPFDADEFVQALFAVGEEHP